MKKTFLLSLAALLVSVPAFASEGSVDNAAYYAIAAAIAIGLAALGGALAQAKIGAAAMEGIARNPQAKDNMFVPMVLGLVLIESLVIYALVVSILIVLKF